MLAAPLMAKRKASKRERTERRFVPQTTTNPKLIYALGGLGAAALGAGVWGQFGNLVRKVSVEPLSYAPWILAGGAIALAVAIWIGTSSAPAVRVGDAGVADEKGTTRRIPWWRVEAVTGDENALEVRGKDDSGAALTVRFERKALPFALPWLLKEARSRVPDKVDVSRAVVDVLGPASKSAGEVLACPPLQLVGKHCADSDEVIAFEPDARVCPRCERIYDKGHVPTTCACGTSLAGLREKQPA